MTELEIVAAKIMTARQPGEIFSSADLTEAKREYLRLARVVHEDRYTSSDQKKKAHDAFVCLQELWSRLANGHVLTIATSRYIYTLPREIHSGLTCRIIEGVAQPQVAAALATVVRLPHSPRDNDLMQREHDALRAIEAKAKGKPDAQPLLFRLPSLLESFTLKTDGRRVNAFHRHSGAEDGWYNLEEIRAEYPFGVDPRVAVFIWNRCLEGLTLAHAAGYAHCAVTPNHVLVHPASHLGQVIDWTSAVRPADGERAPYRDARYEPYFSIEQAFGVRGDLYSLAWSIVYVLGGDPVSRSIPATVPKGIKALLESCLQPKPKNRPASAEVLYQQLRATARSIYGPPSFVEFTMPS